MSGLFVLAGAHVFHDGQIWPDRVLVVRGDRIAGICRPGEAPPEAERIDLPGGTLVPGFVDLQVNGGGGLMFNDDPGPATLATMAEAHARLGATAILPTLITDTPEVTRAAVAAVEAAIAQGVPGILGLHLEGPHLSPARAGAHDPALIRPMTGDDLAFLIDAARRLPVLMVTLAPEVVPPAHIRSLAGAGALVSLGHSDADFETCRLAAEAGARNVTHLFNAMSQLGSRAPGLVGAALAIDTLSAGLIADGVHVHPETLRIAMKAAPGRLHLVSDAMAVAGTVLEGFTLGGRHIRRQAGRLTLADGTLAGADLDMAGAVRILVRHGLADPAGALAMATRVPAELIGVGDAHGALAPGRRADIVWLDKDLRIGAVWRGGGRLAP